MSRPFMILFLLWFIYGFCRYTLKQKFAFNFEFFLYCFYTLVKGKFFNNGVNFVIPWWHWSIFWPTREIWRVCSWSEMFIENWRDIFLFWLKSILFKQYYLFFYITVFILKIRFTFFPKWFGINHQH